MTMNKNLQSPTKLTEFAPLTSEVKADATRFSFSKFFRLKKPDEGASRESINSVGATYNASSHSSERGEEDLKDLDKDSFTESEDARWSSQELSVQRHDAQSRESNSSSTSLGLSLNVYQSDGDNRSMPSIIKRISELLAMKSSNLQSYKDADLKQYWMPDSLSKECFECGDRFTTFRRRHHCRVCGRIFCSRCCNKEIPGKIMGYAGDLRVCTQCCKDILAYLQSNNATDLSLDLRAVQVDLKSQLGDHSGSRSSSPSIQETGGSGTLRRKSSAGYMEERFALGSKGNDSDIFLTKKDTIDELSPVERKTLLQDCVHLRALMIEICKPITGVTLQSHRHRLRTFHSCFVGTELVDWLISQGKATTRAQATKIGQMFIDAGFVECVSHGEQDFVDGYVLYRPQEGFTCQEETVSVDLQHREFAPEAHEPLWLKQIGMQDELFLDSESDDINKEEKKGKFVHGSGRLSSASSMFYLELNVEDNTVSITKAKLESKNSEEERAKKDDITVTGKIPNQHPMLETDLSSTEISEEFLKETLCMQLQGNREFVAPPGWYSSQHLVKETGEFAAFEILSEAYLSHEKTLLLQLLTKEGLAPSWAEVVLPLVHCIVERVKPDVKCNSDDMDIQQYVQIKKVPGGDRSESCIINGVVCSKNVAHRSMPSNLLNPQILLLSSSIIYQRTEGKFLSLEPLWMQEPDYLKNAVARILALKPDILLVERTVSRLAQDSLRNHNVTLVLNVKPSVMERVSRCTQSDVLPSLDAHVGSPRLGMCHRFSVRNFDLGASRRKTLMFFEGCAEHLGCTVLLRGAGVSELRKVKRVMAFMVFVAYNWRLERSFLMDECAMPPTVMAKAIFEAEEEDGKTYQKNMVSAPTGDHGKKEPTFLPEKKTEMREVCDFSDPLQSYLQAGDEDSLPQTDDAVLSLKVAELPFENHFRKALDDTCLSMSPFMKYSIPYLESDTGKRCILRAYLPDEIYCSQQFSKKELTRIKSEDQKEVIPSLVPVGKNNFIVHMDPPHPFVSAQLSTPVQSVEIQALLADFRAQGGRLRVNNEEQSLIMMNEKRDGESGRWEGRVDALDPFNHQRFSVLFGSYSPLSTNAPYFCVNPWVVMMDFYGRKDIPLGCFLERFCFRPTYQCPSTSCETPMLHHIRRFVHDTGCIHIVMKALDGVSFQGENILTWSWCTSCAQVSPIMPMSVDAWSLSFAKYLDLRFHGSIYTRCGASEICSHSLHHDHHQYFLHKNIVAAFKYSCISTWEVNLPPCKIAFKNDLSLKDTLTVEMRDLSVKGMEIFGAVQERLHTLKEDAQDRKYIGILLEQLQGECGMFRSKIEEMQMRLTSAAMEQQKSTEKEFQEALWDVSDCSVQLRYMISDAVFTWNTRIQDLVSQRRKEEKLARTLPKPQAHPQSIPCRKEEEMRSDSCEAPSDGVDGKRSGLEESQSSQLPQSRGGTPEQKRARLCHQPASVPIPRVESDPVLKDCPSQQNQSHEDMHGDSDVHDSDHDRDESGENLGPKTVNISRSRHSSGSSSRGHERSHSDGDGRLVHSTRGEDVGESRNQEKRQQAGGAVKILFSQLLSSSSSIVLQCPLPTNEHYILPTTTIPTVVYEGEPTSIIAFALSSTDYEKQLQDIKQHACVPKVTQDKDVSPLPKRRTQKTSEKESSFQSSTEAGESKRQGVLSFLRGDKSSSGNLLNPPQSSSFSDAWSDTEKSEEADTGEYPKGVSTHPPPSDTPDRAKSTLKNPYQHIEMQFLSSQAKFYCRVYYAEQFRLLRRRLFPQGEESYVRSLQRCVPWAARGGKSGSTFCKTFDDRLILKQMSRFEIQSFVDFAPNYFQYIEKAYSENKPTALAKILGVYRIGYKNTNTNAASKMDVLIMENLFYDRNVTQKFDLKGSVRNRLVHTAGKQEGDLVLLDENLLKMVCESPLYIRPHSKTVLSMALRNDAEFLASQMVMDYSLLVGLDEEKKELVVGIIDYIRTFTWDKRLENFVKTYGILGGQSKMPTVVDPEVYQARFCEAMDRYFLLVPDRWSGMGKGVDC